MTTINPAKIGCKTFTPALVAITPITEGNIAPPACAITKIMPVGSNQQDMHTYFYAELTQGGRPDMLGNEP
jgi:hypothetical protein